MNIRLPHLLQQNGLFFLMREYFGYCDCGCEAFRLAVAQVMWKSKKVHDQCTFFLLCFWMTFPFVRGEPEKLEQEHKEKRTLCNSSCCQGCYDSSGKHLQCVFFLSFRFVCLLEKNVSDHKEMETTEEADTFRCRWVHCSCWASTINTASLWSPDAHGDCGVLLTTSPNSSQACWPKRFPLKHLLQ